MATAMLIEELQQEGGCTALPPNPLKQPSSEVGAKPWPFRSRTTTNRGCTFASVLREAAAPDR